MGNSSRGCRKWPANVSHQRISWAGRGKTRKEVPENVRSTPMAANGKPSEWSKTWTFHEGDWHEATSHRRPAHACDVARLVGIRRRARLRRRDAPISNLHCERECFGTEAVLKPVVSRETWMGLVADGLKRFDKNTPLYIRPMYWAEAWRHADRVSADSGIDPLVSLPLRDTDAAGLGGPLDHACRPFRAADQSNACRSTRRPACLYPNNGRALFEAASRGFDNCLLCDMLGNVAELATANISSPRTAWSTRPRRTGRFLGACTRHRTIKLLRDAGVTVVEGSFRYREFESADEIFSTGNYSQG